MKLFEKFSPLFLFVMLVAGLLSANAQSSWPKEIPFKNGGKVTIFQPQPEKLEGNKLTGRSAVSVKETSKSEPVFGAIFFVATLLTDKDSRTAELESISVTNAKFGGVDDQVKVKSLISLIEAEVPNWNMEMSLDDLVATIKRDRSNSDAYNNEPPTIIYRTKPTSLVILDGEPKIQKDTELDADRVVNSPALIFKEGNQWNMYNGGIWYKSASVTTGWTPSQTMSAKVKSINEQIKKQEVENNEGKEITETPVVTDILVSTTPAELIQSDGAADYQSIAGTSLLYIANSSKNIFKDINSQSNYILIAGRWYKSASLNGPWSYVDADKLPADFAQIPEGSDKDEVLASVAGTDAADEAMVDAEIPQTAKVDRKTATINVEYDGAPKFAPIENSSLQLAENSNVTVMKEASGNYFALDNGVWFMGSSPNGPWNVANARPKDLEKIPASSAAYNTKYVYIYDATPDYVYMGYTAGYMGGYIYGPTIIYGTGFYYRPWWGIHYYPRPFTWGFGFSYNPWSGWSMNFGFNYGFMHFGFGHSHYHGGWFGPPMYRPPYHHRPHYGGGGYYGPNRPGGNRPGGNHYGNTTININNNHNNLYNNHKGVTTRNVDRSRVNSKISNGRDKINNNRENSNNLGRPSTGSSRPSARPAKGDNNIFSDPNGNVYQRDKKGNIRERDNTAKDWKPTQNMQVPDRKTPDRQSPGATRPSNNSPDIQPANKSRDRQPAGSVNRDIQMRDRGAQRTNNFNQSQNRPQAKPAGNTQRSNPALAKPRGRKR